MLFVSLFTPKPTHTVAEAMKRRMEWKVPQGIKPIAEYWLQTNSPRLIAIFEADNIAPIMEANGAWSDLFDINVVPAVTAEEGLKLASQMMPKT